MTETTALLRRALSAVECKRCSSYGRPGEIFRNGEWDECPECHGEESALVGDLRSAISAATPPALSASPAPAVAEGWRSTLDNLRRQLLQVTRMSDLPAIILYIDDLRKAPLAPSASPAQAEQGEALTEEGLRSDIQFWRDDAFRVAASIAERYGQADVANDIRALATRAATPPAGEGREAPILWCVHHRGPDDLHPVESYEAAVALADQMNEIAERFNAGKPRDDIGYVMSISYPAVYPGSADDHAAALAAARTKEG